MMNPEHRRPLLAFLVVSAIVAFSIGNDMRRSVVDYFIERGAPPVAIAVLAPDTIIAESLRSRGAGRLDASGGQPSSPRSAVPSLPIPGLTPSMGTLLDGRVATGSSAPTAGVTIGPRPSDTSVPTAGVSAPVTGPTPGMGSVQPTPTQAGPTRPGNGNGNGNGHGNGNAPGNGDEKLDTGKPGKGKGEGKPEKGKPGKGKPAKGEDNPGESKSRKDKSSKDKKKPGKGKFSRDKKTSGKDKGAE